MKFKQLPKARLPLLATCTYILSIMSINIGFAYVPMYHVWGYEVSPLDIITGIVYLLRDFAQRELGHYVFIAMLIGVGISYYLSDPYIVKASIAAFIVGECIDWIIFTFTKKPLSQRLLGSAMISSPIDSLVFLYYLHHLNLLSWSILTVSKVLGVLVIWQGWRMQQRAQTMRANPAKSS